MDRFRPRRRVDAAPLEFPLIRPPSGPGTATHSGRLGPRRWSTCRTTAEPVEAVVLARSSQRAWTPTAACRRACCARPCLGDSRRRPARTSSRCTTSTGVAPGLPLAGSLPPSRAGNCGTSFYRVPGPGARPRCGVRRDRGDRRGHLDDREYREAQLAAGLVEGRLHLLAYALGASASGMTFIDSEVPLLGEPLDALLFTCVGVPEYVGGRRAARYADRDPPGSRRGSLIRSRTSHGETALPGAEVHEPVRGPRRLHPDVLDARDVGSDVDRSRRSCSPQSDLAVSRAGSIEVGLQHDGLGAGNQGLEGLGRCAGALERRSRQEGVASHRTPSPARQPASGPWSTWETQLKEPPACTIQSGGGRHRHPSTRSCPVGSPGEVGALKPKPGTRPAAIAAVPPSNT